MVGGQPIRKMRRWCDWGSAGVVTMAEPKVICRYTTLAGSVMLADVAGILEAVSATDSVQFVTALPEGLNALRTWCANSATTLVCEDESCVLTVGSCITDHAVDLQRRLPTHDRTFREARNAAAGSRRALAANSHTA